MRSGFGILAAGLAMAGLLWLVLADEYEHDDTPSSTVPVAPLREGSATTNTTTSNTLDAEAVASTSTNALVGTEPMRIGGVPVMASVADDRAARTLGLSGQTGLAPGSVKLFVFDGDDRWSFWMKDMLFPIDMIWVSATGTIVHIEEAVEPSTYPASFKPAVPARFVIETNANFVTKHDITVGDEVVLPSEHSLAD